MGCQGWHLSRARRGQSHSGQAQRCPSAPAWPGPAQPGPAHHDQGPALPWLTSCTLPACGHHSGHTTQHRKRPATVACVCWTSIPPPGRPVSSPWAQPLLRPVASRAPGLPGQKPSCRHPQAAVPPAQPPEKHTGIGALSHDRRHGQMSTQPTAHAGGCPAAISRDL